VATTREIRSLAQPNVGRTPQLNRTDLISTMPESRWEFSLAGVKAGLTDPDDVPEPSEERRTRMRLDEFHD